MNDILQYQDSSKFQFTGHVCAMYTDTGEIVINKFNKIHPQNMARILARGLANEPNSSIFKIKFGNGGTFIDSNQRITFLQPNTVGTNAKLYNTTYEEQVDDTHQDTPISNSVVSSASPAPSLTSVVTVTVEIGPDEPAGQPISDGNVTDPENRFMFDELGVFTSDDIMLTHLIFSPFQKTANRSLLVTYTITIAVA